MRKFIVIILTLSLLGCDDRLAGFEGLLNVDFILNGGIEEAEVKMGLKSGGGKYELMITTSNVSDIQSMSYLVDEGDITVYQDGIEILDGSLKLSSNMNLMIMFNSAEATTITFIMRDKLGTTIEKSLRILVFENYGPVAVIGYNKLAQNDPREYELSGIDSYDQDEEFGGGVAYYEWTVDGNTFIVSSATTKYIFGTAGTYIVRLKVGDNDGKWSEQVSTLISVQ